MGNPWIEHVMKTRRANAGKSFKEILQMAKKTYKKSPAAQKKVHKRKTKRKTQRKSKKRKSKKRKTRKRKRKSRGRKRR